MLTDLALLDDDISARALARQLKFPFIRLKEREIPQQVTSLISTEMARTHVIVPVEQAGGKLMTELRSPGRSGGPLVSQSVITDDNWRRIGLVWDGSNRILYVDDVEVAKDTQTGLAGSNLGLHIGAGSTLDAGSFWSGLIDDVRIYDRAVHP